MLLDSERLAGLLRCPRCRGPLAGPPTRTTCAGSDCGLSQDVFPLTGSGPALIDFGNSIVGRSHFEGRRGESPVHRSESRLRRILKTAGGRNNPVARRNERRFLDELPKAERPRVLVVGSGTVGAGLRNIPNDPGLDVIGLDIYVGKHVNLVADGHAIPLADASVQGVWIQAVLEHVMDPGTVVGEIHRVLSPGGLVYAETPFLQPVHEGAYDFTRFTRSGHRWLFRQFQEVDAGVVLGPGASVAWAVDAFTRALFRSDDAGRLAHLLAAPWRWMDRWCDPERSLDGGNAFYFLGRRSEMAIPPNGMIEYYRGAGAH